MDILLLVAPSGPKTIRASHTSEPNLGLAYIAAYMTERGFRIGHLDCHAEKIPLKDMLEFVLEQSPRIIGFSSATLHIQETGAAAAAIKETMPDIVTVIGGYHATGAPRETLEEFPHFDFAVYGEGEETFHELATAVLAGATDFSAIRGVAWRGPDGITVNPPRPPLMDLDSLPFPMWDLFKLDKYTAHYRTGDNWLELPVSTSRGCPSNCIFCARVTGNMLRKRTVASVMDEIRRDVEQYHAKIILFMSETFSMDRNFIMELCVALIRAGLHKKMVWLCETRVDRVDPELLRAMKNSGCIHVSFGVESGTQEILDKARKGIRLDQVRAAMAAAKQAGLQTDVYIILGLPLETKQTIHRSMRLVHELDPDYVNYFTAVPYPGTAMMEMAKRGEGGLVLMTKDWTKYNFNMGNAMALQSVPLARLKLYQLTGYLRFYLRPKRFGNFLKIVKPKAIPIYIYFLLKSFFTRRNG